MKHKYVFSKDTTTGDLLIREYAELNKDIFALVCETTYDDQKFEAAYARGPEALMAEIRTPNFYPPSSFTEKIVLSITELISSGTQDVLEILCDDDDFLTKSLDGREPFDDSMDDEEDDSLDGFIDDDLPDSFDDGDDVKSGNVGTSEADVEDDAMEDDDA